MRKGYYGASVEEIATEADFSVGTLYNFFKNKSVLYARVIERIAEAFIEEIESSVTPNDDPEAALRALITIRLTVGEAHRGFFRVFFESAPGSHMDPVAALPDSCKGVYERYIAKIKVIIEQGADTGLFRDTDSTYLALAIEGIAAASVTYWSLEKSNATLDTRMNCLADEVLRWIRRDGKKPNQQI